MDLESIGMANSIDCPYGNLHSMHQHWNTVRSHRLYINLSVTYLPEEQYVGLCRCAMLKCHDIVDIEHLCKGTPLRF